jgi:hypothetical protein
MFGMDTVLSLLALAATALVVGAILQWRRHGPRKQVWLMLVLAAIMIANVLIWTIPDDGGTAPVDRAAAGPR